MTIYYSAATGGFYQAADHGTNIPADAVEISGEDYAALFAAPFVGKRIAPDALGRPVLIDLPAPLVTADGLCAKIDAAADAARRAVAGDPLRAVEYQLAATEAQAFAAAGYPAEAVPRTVSAWVKDGRTPPQAADSILAEAAQYNEAIYLLRETRLQAKDQVRQAMDAGEVEQAQSIAAQTIASIEAAVAGIGNNTGG